MKVKRFLLIVFICSIYSVGIAQQPAQLKSGFIKSFTNGDVEALAPYFKGYTSIQMPDHSGLFPAGKSKIYLRNFIKEHPATHFQFIKAGYTGDNYYLIGRLESGHLYWTIYILFDINDTKSAIQQIEIEKTEK